MTANNANILIFPVVRNKMFEQDLTTPKTSVTGSLLVFSKDFRVRTWHFWSLLEVYTGESAQGHRN